MNTIYLGEHRDVSLIGRVSREWNSGSNLSQAVRYLETRHGFDRAAIISVWRTLWKQCGCKSIGWRPRKETNTDPAYLAWKGIIGPGAQLRAIVKEERS